METVKMKLLIFSSYIIMLFWQIGLYFDLRSIQKQFKKDCQKRLVEEKDFEKKFFDVHGISFKEVREYVKKQLNMKNEGDNAKT